MASSAQHIGGPQRDVAGTGPWHRPERIATHHQLGDRDRIGTRDELRERRGLRGVLRVGTNGPAQLPRANGRRAGDPRVRCLAEDPIVERERARGIEQTVLARTRGAEQRIGKIGRCRSALDRGDRSGKRRRIICREAIDQRRSGER